MTSSCRPFLSVVPFNPSINRPLPCFVVFYRFYASKTAMNVAYNVVDAVADVAMSRDTGKLPLKTGAKQFKGLNSGQDDLPLPPSPPGPPGF